MKSTFFAVQGQNKEQMMLLAFFLSIFGLLIAFRTIDFLISNRFLAPTRRKFSVLTSFIVLLGCQVAFRHHLVIVWIVEVFLFLAPIFVFQIQESVRKRHFKENIVPFLDSIMVQMRAGRTLKESIHELILQQEGASHYYLQEILSVLQFSSSESRKSPDSFFEEVLHELQEIQASSHKAIDKIKAFRRKVKIERDFHQKSRQVTIQIRLQSLILGILFLSLLAYSIFAYDFTANRGLYFMAVVLFLFGVTFNLFILRRFRWKV